MGLQNVAQQNLALWEVTSLQQSMPQTCFRSNLEARTLSSRLAGSESIQEASSSVGNSILPGHAENHTAALWLLWLIQQLAMEIRARWLSCCLHLRRWPHCNVEGMLGVDQQRNAERCTRWIHSPHILFTMKFHISLHHISEIVIQEFHSVCPSVGRFGDGVNTAPPPSVCAFSLSFQRGPYLCSFFLKGCDIPEG